MLSRLGEAAFVEYDDRLPDVPKADRGDRLQQLRNAYRDATDAGFGVPHTNQRDGWIRVK
jgi:hypothetical protein